MTKRAEQILQKAQGQTLACLAVGFAGALDGAQTWHVGTSRIAMQDLQHKQVHRGHGIKHALTPDMADRFSDGADERRAEKLGYFGLDLLHSSEDTAGHPWPPVGVW
jgi:hypothetical protein